MLFAAALESIANVYACQMSGKLPVNPVVAEDKKRYELRYIVEYLNEHTENLKSPSTGKPMGRQLRPDPEALEVIEILMSSGAITGHKAELWEVRAEVNALTAQAEERDPAAIFRLANILCGRGRDEALDFTKGVHWFQIGAAMNYPPAMAAAGEFLVQGVCVDKNVSDGMILLSAAAERGSAYAAFILGCWFETGAYGMKKNPVRAKEFLNKIASCEFDDLTDEKKRDATKKLSQL